MKSRTRARDGPLHRFLRPGALARLRDSRIRPRSADLLSIPIFLSSPRPPYPAVATMTSPVQPENGTTAMMAQDVEVDASPSFAVRSYAPRFLQRRRLFASKAVVLPHSVAESADLLLAH